MILTVQQAVEALLTSAQMSTNVAAVNTKFAATGVAITVPTAGNIYTYENESLRFDNTGAVVFVLPSATGFPQYSSSSKAEAQHNIDVAFVLRDQDPATLDIRKMMYAEAALPLFVKGIRDGGSRYNSWVDRIDYQPQFSEGVFRVTDVVIRLIVKEYIPVEEVQS